MRHPTDLHRTPVPL